MFRLKYLASGPHHAAPRGVVLLLSTALLCAGLHPTPPRAAAALAQDGEPQDLEAVAALLADDDPDVRIFAARATLRTLRQSDRRLGPLDWLVITLYGAGMIAVGWYAARKAATAEDYLLGGRTMKPWAVGLSLFATLLSTITYLAIPGEMIRHGPMFVSQILVFPLIVWVVGWFLIPRFMQLEVTSAYELLEKRLGVEVRTLGAVFFLTMRLFWMAVIVYATVSKVLIPQLGWDQAAAPYACAVLGAITVIYTSLGGIRAVVITDVIQTFVLLLGAALAMCIITFQLGGISHWWPTQWVATWDPPKLWFDPGSRATVATVAGSVFGWHVCTAGSDQMAVQRYLSTRDVSAARRMFATSLGVNALALGFLALLGLSLLAFFQARPELLAQGQSVQTSADQLLPRFLVIGLPQGVSGLILAALLAAAMSSLSSGINSSCSIVTVDFVQRFRGANASPAEPAAQLRLARYISWGIGTVVVLLSSGSQWVPGNLLEVTYRVVNLLTAPLFLLFFMALFVPWATTWGTLAAAALSVATAVAIAFYDLGGLSFLWVIPGSLMVGVAAGMILSCLGAPRQTLGTQTDS
jgi:SSS family solute:Na+ symporter